MSGDIDRSHEDPLSLDYYRVPDPVPYYVGDENRTAEELDALQRSRRLVKEGLASLDAGVYPFPRKLRVVVADDEDGVNA